MAGLFADIGAYEDQDPFNIFGTQNPPTVQSVGINDGSAQRSEVRTITITFSGPVTFTGGNANAAAAFQLQNVLDSTNIANLQAVVSANPSGQTIVTLTFTTSGNASTEIDPISAENGGAPSLADGRFQLTVLAANVSGPTGLALAGAENTAGVDYVSPTDTLGGGPGELGLFRLFGDATGNGIVDQLDLAQFRTANNSSSGSAAYIAYLDADNSGTIDQIDLAQFRCAQQFQRLPHDAECDSVGDSDTSATPSPTTANGPTGLADPNEMLLPSAASLPATVSPAIASNGSPQPPALRTAAPFLTPFAIHGEPVVPITASPSVQPPATVSADNHAMLVGTPAYPIEALDNGGTVNKDEMNRFRMSLTSATLTAVYIAALDDHNDGTADYVALRSSRE